MQAMENTDKTGLKLNLGCGNKKLDGYINIDGSDHCKPDLLFDLENTPYPFQSNSVDEIRMKSVLEHFPLESKKFFKLIKEIYRICANKAKIYIECPHPFHRWQVVDFTHQKAIHIEGLQMLDKEYCEKLIEAKSTKSPLGIMYDIDFKIEKFEYTIDPKCKKHIENVLGKFEKQKIESYSFLFNNVAATQKITLMARK